MYFVNFSFMWKGFSTRHHLGGIREEDGVNNFFKDLFLGIFCLHLTESSVEMDRKHG